jgi:cytochrome P450
MFGRDSLLINRPDDIRRVLVENDENYARTRPTIRILRPLLGNGLFLAADEEWRHQRRTTAPAFGPKATPAFARATARALQDAIPGLASRPSQEVDLLSWLQHLTLDVAGRALFSLPMKALSAPLRRRIGTYGARYGRPTFPDFFLPLAVPSPRDIGRAWFARRWFPLIDRLIAERERLGDHGGRHDLYDLLRAARHPETGAPFSETEFRDQVATLIVAGHETTAVALFWACYLLALAPAWQDLVAREAADLDLRPEGAADAIARLEMAKAVVQESLRLYPPAFVIVRLAKGSDRLAEIAVGPGTVVMVAPWVLHRHVQLWRQPGAFDPTRFLPGAPSPDRYAFLPFGIGPRVCIGASLAMTEATLVLASIVRTFRITLADSRPVLPIAVITTQPDHAVPFLLVPR